MEGVVHRPYMAPDIEGLSKKELIELVKQQFDLWPHESYKWAPKRDTTVKVLQNVLLSPEFGFGRVVPSPEIDAVTRDLVGDEGDTEHEPDVETISCDALELGGDDSSHASEANQTDPEDRANSMERDDPTEAENGVQSATIDLERPPTSRHAPVVEAIRESVPPTLRQLMVILTDHRPIQSVSSGTLKSRILLQVEESLTQRDGAPMTPETWFVNPNHLIQVLQVSPAFIEGPVRLSTFQREVDSNEPIYDILATIDETLSTNCVSYPIMVSSDSLAVHIHDHPTQNRVSALNTTRKVTGRRRLPHYSSSHQPVCLPRNQNRTQSPSLTLSDHTGGGVLATDGSKGERIVEYLRDATSKDPNCGADWRFFLDSKGKSLSDADLVRVNIFAVEFIEKWQDERITVKDHGECRVLQRHIYKALKRNPSWFVSVHQLVGLLRKVGPGSETPDALVVSHLKKGEKTGTARLIALLQSAVNRQMPID